MKTVYRDIFRAIHEDKWLSIEYRNKADEVTKYWIGIKSISVTDKTMCVEGLHLSQYTTMEFTIYIDSIISTAVIEGSIFLSDAELKEDIKINPQKYKFMFHNVARMTVMLL